METNQMIDVETEIGITERLEKIWNASDAMKENTHLYQAEVLKNAITFLSIKLYYLQLYYRLETTNDIF